VTFDDVRRLAMEFPEATEEPHFEMTSFRIKGRIFATAPAGGEFLHIFVDENEVRASVAADPETFSELWWGKRLSGLRVTVASADAADVKELLTEAWLRKAPKKMAAAFRSSEP
jgi:hypothetical protein